MTAQGVKFAIQVGSIMLLSRLLTPADFGLVAMVTAITGFVAMFKDAGLSMATVQHSHITHEQVTMLFWVNLCVGALLMVGTGALAPAIAQFYSEPRLTAITLVLAGTFLFGGLTVQHQAILQRQMRFRALAVTQVVSAASGIVAALTVAFWIRSYWALVVMAAATSVSNAAAVWAVCRWVPSLPGRNTGVRSLIRFGSTLTGANICNYIAQTSDRVLIGRFGAPSALGLYSRAFELLLLPLRQINSPLSYVMIPVLSRLQDDPLRYRRAFLAIQESLALIIAPLVGAIAASSESLILVVLGEQWKAAAPLFMWLSAVALVNTVYAPLAWLWITQGRTWDLLSWTALDALVTVVAVSVGVLWGAEGVARAYAAATVVKLPAYVWLAGRKGPVRWTDILYRTSPSMGLAGCTFCVALCVLSIDADLPPAAKVGLAILTYCAALAFPMMLSRRVRFLWHEMLDRMISRRQGQGTLPCANE